MLQNQYTNIDLLWRDTLDDLLEAPSHDSRNGESKEMLGYSVVLLNPNRNYLLNTRRKISPSYAAGEILWYLTGQAEGRFITHYAPSYTRFLDDDGLANGGYGARIGQVQIRNLIELLQAKTNTRQAVISLWQRRDLEDAAYGDPRDIPCTLSLQFVVRNDELNLFVTMRSNDAWLGLPYDIFAFTCLQQLIASKLDLIVGRYFHNVASMHLYEKDYDAAREAASKKHSVLSEVFMHESPKLDFRLEDLILRALDMEECFRLKSPVPEGGMNGWQKSLLGHLVTMASTRSGVWSREGLIANGFSEIMADRLIEEMEKHL